jgi:hypothetical protein
MTKREARLLFEAPETLDQDDVIMGWDELVKDVLQRLELQGE